MTAAPLLTTDEVAAILQVAPRTVRALPIECSRIGRQIRYKLEDVHRYINAQKENAVDDEERGIRYRRDRKRWEHRKFFRGKIFSGLHQTEAEARDALAALERRIEVMKRVPANTLGAVINDGG
jgi:hypothetical protein